jgi:hypothetical protein
MSLFFFYLFCGVRFFCSSRKHLLITLLRLDVAVLALFVIIYFYLSLFNYELYFVMIFWRGGCLFVRDRYVFLF